MQRGGNASAGSARIVDRLTSLERNPRNHPAAFVEGSTAQSIPSNANALVTLTNMNRVADQSGSELEPTPPGLIKINSSGIVMVTITAAFASNSVGNRFIVLQNNGATMNEIRYTLPTPSGVVARLQTSGAVWVNVGDVLTIGATQTSGANLNVIYARLAVVQLARF